MNNTPESQKVKNNAPANHGPIIRENCASHEINAPRTALNKKNAPESASTLYVRHLRHPRSRHLGERHVAPSSPNRTGRSSACGGSGWRDGGGRGASALWRGFAVDMNDWAAARFGVLPVDWLMSVVKGARQRVLSTTRSGSHFFSFSWSSLIKRR